MSQKEVFAVLCEVVRDRLHVEQPLAPEMEFGRDLAIDSLHQMTLLAALEKHFDVELQPEDEAAIRTLGDLAERIALHLAGGAAKATAATP